MLAFTHNWGCLLYALIVGGVIFVASVIAPIAADDVRLSNRDDRRTVFVLIVGFLFYAALFLIWQLAAIGRIGGSR